MRINFINDSHEVKNLFKVFAGINSEWSQLWADLLLKKFLFKFVYLILKFLEQFNSLLRLLEMRITMSSNRFNRWT